MDEYISKRAAIDMICSKCTVDTPDSCSTIQRGDDWCEEMYYLLKTSAADVVPVVHSRWVLGGYDDMYYVCEKCKHKQSEYYIKPTANFCPNCGARMDGERKE